MDEGRVEDLLQQRAEQRQRPGLSPQNQERVRASIRAEARPAAGPARLLLATLSTLAAGALLMYGLQRWLSTPAPQPLLAEVQLLDGAGRPMQRVLRGQAADAPPLPEAVTLEFTSREEAHVHVVLYDTDGRLTWPEGRESFEAAADVTVLRRYSVTLDPDPDAARLTFLVIASREPISAARLELLPLAWQGRDEAALGMDLARKLGADVRVVSWTFQKP